MRILHILAYPIQHIGGVETYVRNLASFLKKKNIDSDTISSDINNHFSKVEKNLCNNNQILIKNYGNIMNIYPIFSIFLYLVNNYRKYDIIHIHSYIYIPSIEAILFSKLFKIPTLLTLHGLGHTELKKEGQFNNLKERILYLIKRHLFDKIFGRFVIKNCNFLTSVSKTDINRIHKIFALNRGQNYWIPNSVNQKLFFEQDKTRKYITFVGRFSEIKGYDLFIKIAQKLNRYRKNIPFLIVGMGKLKNKFNYSALNVKFIPKIEYEMMANVYNLTKIFINSSRFEGMPTTILESLACGTPVVASNVGGVSEIITNGVNGYLYDYNNIEQAVNYIIELLEKPEMAHNFSVNGKKSINESFDWNKNIDKFVKLYDRILTKKKMVKLKN
jgi:glycosyltransferase involved in cell wall biosynthesis